MGENRRKYVSAHKTVCGIRELKIKVEFDFLKRFYHSLLQTIEAVIGFYNFYIRDFYKISLQ